MTGEPSVTKECAPTPCFCHQLCARLVDIFRGDPRTKHRRKLLKDSACQFARGAHLFNFLRCLDWDHATISLVHVLKKAFHPRATGVNACQYISSIVKVSARGNPSKRQEPLLWSLPWKNDSP